MRLEIMSTSPAEAGTPNLRPTCCRKTTPSLRLDQLELALLFELLQLGTDHVRAVRNMRVLAEIILMVFLRDVKFRQRANLRDNRLIEMSGCNILLFLCGFVLRSV